MSTGEACRLIETVEQDTSLKLQPGGILEKIF